jgi:radical SAM protein with 4Fe4S-binding SPASM domain
MKLVWPLRREPETLPVPDGYVMFWPTGRCNFRCRHCKLAILDQRRAELSFEEISTIFGRSRILAGLPISIAGGEPFVRKDMVEILDFLTRHGNPVFVTTNGWYLDRIRRLSEVGHPELLTIGVSVDGVGETHDTIRRKGAFARSAEAIEIARAAGCHVQINTVVQPDNLATVEGISEYFQRLGVHQVFIPLATFPNLDERHVTPDDYPDETVARVARWVNSQSTDAKYVLSRGTWRIQDCHAGSTSCYIDPEGDVYACMTMKEWSEDPVFKMGSLREMDFDFDALWGSSRAHEVRRQVKTCAGCYTGCEVSRETRRHGLDGTIDAETLTSRLKAPAALNLDDPTSSPYLTGEWYWIEDGFRWMGRTAGLRLMRPAGPQRVRVRAWAGNPDLNQRPLTGKVLVDGATAGRFTITAEQAGRYFDLDYSLRPATRPALAEIRIEVDRTWVPKQCLGTPDDRRLGLNIAYAGFEVA